MLSRISAVGVEPLAKRSLSKLAKDLSKAEAGKVLCGIFGLMVSAQRLATARPNTTKSSKELEPKRLAPCTDTQAASPMEYKPGTTVFGSPFFKVTTSP